MDKRRSILNISTSVVSRVVLLVSALVVRRLLIHYIGNDVNGLNSLYTSIIGMLGVTELGIGSAIVFSMYSPIVLGDRKKVAALYGLYRKLYLIIGLVIFGAGLAVMPFLPALISDYDKICVDVHGTFFLTLVSVVLSYGYSAKTSLIEAHKDNYITTGILTIGNLVRYCLQAVAILLWASYPAFLACQIIGTVVVWLLTELAVRRKHGDIIRRREKVDDATKKEISRNVKAMVMHRIGTVLVHGVDSMIISGFIGVVILGKYSNYNYVAGIVAGTIGLFFTPLTSIVGHLCAAGDREEIKRSFDHFYILNYVLGFIFFLGYFAVVDGVIALLFGPGLEVARPVAFVITLNQFTQYMRNAGLLFRNASGTFYNDRWKPVAEGVINLLLSLFFVKVFPEEYKVVGVIAATIITTLVICNTVEPYVIFRHVFGRSPKAFYLRHYAYTGLFACALFVMARIVHPYDSEIRGILVNGFLSVGLSIGMLCLVFLVDKGFRTEVRIIGKKLLHL